MGIKPTPLQDVVPSPREIAWWFCLPVHRLTPRQQDHLQLLQGADRELNALYELAQAFFCMIRA
jgi:hypothetical protein